MPIPQHYLKTGQQPSRGRDLFVPAQGRQQQASGIRVGRRRGIGSDGRMTEVKEHEPREPRAPRRERSAPHIEATQPDYPVFRMAAPMRKSTGRGYRRPVVRHIIALRRRVVCRPFRRRRSIFTSRRKRRRPCVCQVRMDAREAQAAARIVPSSGRRADAARRRGFLRQRYQAKVVNSERQMTETRAANRDD